MLDCIAAPRGTNATVFRASLTNHSFLNPSLDSHTNLATKSIPPAGRNFLGFFENWYRRVIDI